MKIRTAFLLVILILCLGKGGWAEIAYPWKNVYIGAMDASGWAGLAMAPHPDAGFAFKVRVNRGSEAAEGIDFGYLVSEVGPHSPDGRYARIRFDLSLPFGQGDDTPVLKKPSSKSTTMTLEWSRQNEDTVIGRIIAPKDVQLQLIHYFPWNSRGRYRLREDGQLEGEGLALQKYHYLFWAGRPGDPEGRGEEGSEVVLSYPMNKNSTIYFVAGVGEDPEVLSNRIYRYKNEKTIQSFLAEEAQIYDQNRVRAFGAHRGLAAAVTNNLFWGTLYQPGKHRFYTPSGRNHILETGMTESFPWITFSGDSFFNALVLSLESPKHAKDMLSAALETQFPNGNIPQWRAGAEGSPDRSQPPIGAYVVLKLFQKTGDEELLRFAYPYLTRWHAFWTATKSNGLIRRDGNGDGLLEWGSDSELVSENDPFSNASTGLDRARLESGMPDLPNWEDAGFDRLTGTMTMNCLDLNCLFALDAYCLAQMASVLQNPRENSEYLEEYDNLKRLINDNLWDSQRGFYVDRHWDGRVSRKVTVTSFYPLLARIPDAERARQLRAHLLDRTEFWGDYVMPTVSRASEIYQEQQAWRGAVWPSANYLIYQGLKAFGMDVEAQEFAKKSADLFQLAWKNFQICPQNYDSRTGEATGARYHSWGPLMALIALEELIDITPWEGFRFGVLQPDSKGEVRRVAIQGRHYDVRVSSGEIRLMEEGREIVKSKGSMVVRRFLYNEQLVSFDVMTLAKRKIRIRFLTKGKYQYFLDDQVKEIFTGDVVDIEVPEGGHEVLIMLVEKAR